jgi:hypothetical protein
LLPRSAWSPGHKGIPVNEKANTVAGQATAVLDEPTDPVDERIRKLKGALQLIEKNRSDNSTLTKRYSTVGQYTWQLDQALPCKHTLAIYSISSEEASVLIQARTGNCRLNQGLYRLKIMDTANCQCGDGEESIQYVLLTVQDGQLQEQNSKQQQQEAGVTSIASESLAELIILAQQAGQSDSKNDVTEPDEQPLLSLGLRLRRSCAAWK